VNLNIIVIGGGMTGTAIAVGLLQSGAHVTLVDAAPSQVASLDGQDPVRVSTLSPASENILEHLGVWQEIKKSHSHQFLEMLIWEDERRNGLGFGAKDAGLGHLGHVVENNRVSSILRERFLHLGGELHTGVPLKDVETRRHKVEAILENGQQLSADLLVAADGSRSIVRRLLDFPLTHHDYQQFGIVCKLRCPVLNQRTAWQRFLKQGPIAFLPLGDECFSIVWSMNKVKADHYLNVTDGEFQTALADAFQIDPNDLSLQSARAGFPLHKIHARQYVKSKVVLVGDAAHVVHPLAGQGANMGLLDVAALLEELAADQNLDNALRRYERWRRSDNELMLSSLHGLKRFFELQHFPFRLMRRVGFEAINQISWLRSALVTHASGFGGQVPHIAKQSGRGLR